MATQQLEFGYRSGLTLTATAAPVGSSGAPATASAVTEVTGQSGTYRATFTDLAAGLYRLTVRFGTTEVLNIVIDVLALDGIYSEGDELTITFPDPSQVLIGVDRGDGTLGTYEPPGSSGCNYPDASDVRSGVDRGDGVLGTLVITTGSALTVEEREGVQIDVFTDESVTINKVVTDAVGQAVDLTGQSLQFYAWARDRQTFINVAATGLVGGFEVTIPAQAIQRLSAEWALRRNDSSRAVIKQGPFRVIGRPG